MTAEEAMAEIWGLMCPDCGPKDYDYIVKHLANWLAEEKCEQNSKHSTVSTTDAR